jgi:biotin operon repressor
MTDDGTQNELTTKQTRVLELAQGGLSVDEIAERTSTSPQNVYNHVRNLREKGYEMPQIPQRGRGPTRPRDPAAIKNVESMIVAEQRNIERLHEETAKADQRLKLLQETRKRLEEIG